VPIDLPEGRGAVVAFTDIEDRLLGEQVRDGRDAVLVAREDSLRRIAALVAGGAASGDVFAAIAREVAHVVGLPLVLVWRFDPGKTSATVIGEWSVVPHSWRAGTRWPLDGPGLAVQMLKTGRPREDRRLRRAPRLDRHGQPRRPAPGICRRPDHRRRRHVGLDGGRRQPCPPT
jgi:hypothetical protein